MPINNPQKPQVEGSVLRPTNRWKTLLFYQKANTLFQLTVVFCERFLPKYGDRTVSPSGVCEHSEKGERQ